MSWLKPVLPDDGIENSNRKIFSDPPKPSEAISQLARTPWNGMRDLR